MFDFGDLEPVEYAERTWEVYDAAFFAAAGVPSHHIETASKGRQEQRRAGVSGVWTYPLQANIAAA